MFKKTILIDLDGVLNTYTGNFDENVIPPIKKGALEFISIQFDGDYKKLQSQIESFNVWYK